MKDIDVVFHEAALASVTLSVKNPILSSQISNNLNAFVIRS
jgi:nucleoside-diphosphate-sugar epimerase